MATFEQHQPSRAENPSSVQLHNHKNEEKNKVDENGSEFMLDDYGASGMLAAALEQMDDLISSHGLTPSPLPTTPTTPSDILQDGLAMLSSVGQPVLNVGNEWSDQHSIPPPTPPKPKKPPALAPRPNKTTTDVLSLARQLSVALDVRGGGVDGEEPVLVSLRELLNKLESKGSPVENGSSTLVDHHYAQTISLSSTVMSTNGRHHQQQSSAPWSPLHTSSSSIGDDPHDRIMRLEKEKQSLQLQVSILKDQVDAQEEKIRDMETNNQGDYNLGTPSDKLGIYSELSAMRMKLTGIEKEKSDLEKHYHSTALEKSQLQAKLNDREHEMYVLRRDLDRGSSSSSSHIIPPLPDQSDVALASTLTRLKRKNTEIERLRRSVDALMLTNSDKEREIEELKTKLSHHRNRLKVGGDGVESDESLHPLEADIQERLQEERPAAAIGKSSTLPHHATTNIYEDRDAKSSSGYLLASSPPLPPPTSQSTPRDALPPSNIQLANSNSAPNIAEAVLMDTSSGSPTAEHRSPRQYATLDSHQKKKTSGIKKWFGKLRRSSSREMEESDSSKSPTSPGPNTNGVDNIYDNIGVGGGSAGSSPDGDEMGFVRGGVRSTAGPRLAWSRDLRGQSSDLDIPFARWDGDTVAAWLHQIGLTAYVSDCKRWLKNGDQLLKATQADLEKELHMKHALHRKKLRLALQSLAAGDDGGSSGRRMGELDYHWVTRWLDDIGMAQYKEQFSEARVDGRMLHYMTVDELLLLKVGNAFHHVSFKRAIQLLRRNNYNPHCIIRRPLDNSPAGHHEVGEVMCWSNHRILEWLRTVDLTEYSANLRGSGLHGALMVLEPRFNADTLASILNIPHNKSLLRRHLSTHFTQLMGGECMKMKRDVETHMGYQPITPLLKTKVKRKIGLIKKKNKNEMDFDEYVCPMDIQSPTIRSSPPNGLPPRLTHTENGGADKEIGAMSKEISSLMTQLNYEDDYLDNPSISTSNV